LRMNRKGLLSATAAAALCFSTAGCGAKVSAEKKNAANPSRDPMEITVSADLEKQIQIASPSVASVADTMTVTARVEADRRRTAAIHSPVAGRIVELHVFGGEDVEKGQVLGTLNGTGLTDIQLSLLKAHTQQQLGQRAVERANLLLGAGVIGSAEVQRRQAELQETTAEIGVLRDQLKVLGMPEDSIARLESTRTVNSLTEIVSEMAGTILERKAAAGQIVQPSDTVYEVADLSNVWVVADVPEQDAGNMVVGKTAETEISAFPGQRIQGRLSYVSPIVNPETRTVQVRVDLPNPQRKYKPDMLATMNLRDRTAQRTVVPQTAVVREDNNRDYVFVQRRDKTFVLRPVELGAEFDTVRVLLGGVEPGEKIVTDGAFHLNNERRRRLLTGEN